MFGCYAVVTASRCHEDLPQKWHLVKCNVQLYSVLLFFLPSVRHLIQAIWLVTVVQLYISVYNQLIIGIYAAL